jgi:hypothetical protein
MGGSPARYYANRPSGFQITFLKSDVAPQSWGSAAGVALGKARGF